MCAHGHSRTHTCTMMGGDNICGRQPTHTHTNIYTQYSTYKRITHRFCQAWHRWNTRTQHTVSECIIMNSWVNWRASNYLLQTGKLTVALNSAPRSLWSHSRHSLARWRRCHRATIILSLFDFFGLQTGFVFTIEPLFALSEYSQSEGPCALHTWCHTPYYYSVCTHSSYQALLNLFTDWREVNPA